MKGQPTWFEIPARTRAAECRSCGAVVYWIETAHGRRMPVSIEIPGAFAPTDRDGGRGISHFADCPHADQHRKAR